MEGKISLLSGFGVTLQGRPLSLSPISQKVVAFVALRRRPVPRSVVTSTLWPDADETRSSANLRSALWRMRGPGGDLLITQGGRLQTRENVSVDVQSMTELAERLTDDDDTCEDLDLDDGLLCHELLPEWYEDWVLLERERLRQLRLHALDALTRRLIAIGRYGHAVQVGMRAVQEEPLRESAHRLLVEVHLAEGNISEAVRQYRTYRDLLHEELGLKPSEQMSTLLRQHAPHAVRAVSR